MCKKENEIKLKLSMLAVIYLIYNVMVCDRDNNSCDKILLHYITKLLFSFQHVHSYLTLLNSTEGNWAWKEFCCWNKIIIEPSKIPFNRKRLRVFGNHFSCYLLYNFTLALRARRLVSIFPSTCNIKRRNEVFN